MSSEMSTRKQQILEIASDMLRTKGFEAFSYQDLSIELGIKKASIHHHFPKKEDLGLALCQWTKDWLEQGLSHFDVNGVSSWDKLQRYVRASQKHALNDNKICPLSSLHGDLSRLPASMVAEMKKLDAIELGWVISVLEDGRENGEFIINGETTPIAAMFIFSIKGALHYSQLHDQDLVSGALKQFDRLLRKTNSTTR